jgi:hypothetical protein
MVNVKNNAIRAGSVSGTIKPNGYREIMIDCRLYKAHRVLHGCIFMASGRNARRRRLGRPRNHAG